MDQFWAGWQLEIVRFNERHAVAAVASSAEDDDALRTAHEIELDALRYELVVIETRLRESKSQRAILESVISERLESERAAVTNADKMQHALCHQHGRVAELTAEREQSNLQADALREVKGEKNKKMPLALIASTVP